MRTAFISRGDADFGGSQSNRAAEKGEIEPFSLCVSAAPREHFAALRRRKNYSRGRTLSNGAASFRIIAIAGGAVALFCPMPNYQKRRADAGGIVGLKPLSGG